MENRIYISKDRVSIAYNVWVPEGDVKALVHINHGMAEHSKRYDRFAKELNKSGFLVFAQDHRGHGSTITDTQPKGHMDDKDGWNKVCDDAYNICAIMSEEYGDKDVFLFGHSMGSFIGRNLIAKHPRCYKAAVLMGTGYKPSSILSSMGKYLAKKGVKKFGREPNNKLDSIVFGGFSKKIKNPNTPFDWLSRDEKEVQKYIDDPYCGYACSSQFYYDVVEGSEFANNINNVKYIEHKIPLLIISGDNDPVGNNGKGVKKVASMYKRAGYEVTLRLISGARHELLNETNRDDIIKDIICWYNKKLRD